MLQLNPNACSKVTMFNQFDDQSETVLLLTCCTISYTSVTRTSLSVHTFGFISNLLQNEILNSKQVCILSNSGHSEMENVNERGLVLFYFFLWILGKKDASTTPAICLYCSFFRDLPVLKEGNR